MALGNIRLAEHTLQVGISCEAIATAPVESKCSKRITEPKRFKTP